MTVATHFELVSEVGGGPLMRWAGERCGVCFSPPATVLGVVKNGNPVCVVVFNDYTGENVELSVAADNMLPRRFLQLCAEYAFGQLGCLRVTVRTRASNVRVADMARRLGFKQEGVLREFYGNEDAFLFGLLRREAGKVFRSRLQ